MCTFFICISMMCVGPSPVPTGGQEAALRRSVRDPTQPQRGRAQEQRARTRGRRTEKTEKRRGTLTILTSYYNFNTK